MPTLVLLRHGQSVWNKENLFTGWVDVDLSEQGEREAAEAGRLLAESGHLPDIVFTSMLKRAIRTAHIALAACGRESIPEIQNWRLNERHYGALQGLNKADSVSQFGEEQVKAWRRSYDVPPPPMTDADWNELSTEPLYRDLNATDIPRSECLADVVKRVLPYYESTIARELTDDRTVLVAAHGNSLRALVKQLESISDDDIVNLELPTGVPRVYEMTDQNTIISVRELGDAAAIAAARTATAAQTNQK